MTLTNPNENLFELLDQNLEQIARLKGDGFESLPPGKEMGLKMNSSFSEDSEEGIYLWGAGGGKLGVVDLKNMEYDLIEGLGSGPSGSQDAQKSHAKSSFLSTSYLPLSALSANSGRKILTLTANEAGSSLQYSFNYWEKRKEGLFRVESRSSEYVHFELKTVSAIELSEDKRAVLAVGGPTSFRSVIIAFSFDGYFQSLCHLSIEETIGGMARLKGGDYFVLGGKGKVIICSYKAEDWGLDKPAEPNTVSRLPSLTNLHSIVLPSSSPLHCVLVDGLNSLYLMDKEGKDYCNVIIK